MRVKILIQNKKESEKMEAMGLESEPVFFLTDFYFKEDLVESFWVDEEDEDIVFSLNGDDYRTPYTEALMLKFKEILE